MSLENLTSEESDAVVHLTKLIKANDLDKDLSKAKKSGDGEDNSDSEDSYNEAYMKKYMKQFSSKNPDYMKKMGFMKKAIDTQVAVAGENNDLSVDATMIDGTELFKTFQEFAGTLLKAFEIQNERIAELEEKIQFSNDVVAASGEVLIKASETLDKIAELPAPLKSQQVADPALIQKAQPVHSISSRDDLLQKAKDLDIRQVKDALFKAATEQNNQAAGLALSKLEMSGNRLQLLDPATLRTVTSIVQVPAQA